MTQKLFPLLCLWLLLLPSPARATSRITLQEYPLPQGLTARYILFGPQGDLWFTMVRNGDSVKMLGRSTTSGKITLFPVPFFISEDNLATMGDGNLWFFPQKRTAIACLTPTGKVTLFPITHGFNPHDLSYNAGSLWFLTNGYVNALSPTGHITIFPLPSNIGGDYATGGPDGNLWITDVSTNSIVRVSPIGKVTLFPIPSSHLFYGSFYTSLPAAITSGPDGNLWFIEDLTHKVGRITPQGVITEFFNPSFAPLLGSCNSIVTGSDHNLWFTCENDSLFRFTTTGQVTIFHPLTRKSDPYGMTPGPDHSLWFAEALHSALGEITHI